MVQSAKRALKRVIGRSTLTFLELQTVLAEVEVLLNSRPLCPLYENDFEEPLTPNHLVFGRRLDQHNVKGQYDISTEVTPKRVRYINSLVEHFWERWRCEYVGTLRNAQQKYKKRNSLVPMINDIVLIYEEKVPRQSWCMGRVIEIIPSKDDQIRGAKILIGKSRHIIERPVNKLFPIEFAQDVPTNATENTDVVEIINHEEHATGTPLVQKPTRIRREAAVAADIKRKQMR